MVKCYTWTYLKEYIKCVFDDQIVYECYGNKFLRSSVSLYSHIRIFQVSFMASQSNQQTMNKEQLLFYLISQIFLNFQHIKLACIISIILN